MNSYINYLLEGIIFQDLLLEIKNFGNQKLIL